MWSLGVWALICSLFLGKGLFTKHRRLRIWRDALALYKVSGVEISSLWSWRARITFRSGPLTVRITGARTRNRKKTVKVVIEGAEGFSILKLRRELWEQEIEIGDEEFEVKFLVEGPVRPVSALLDAKLRSQLLRASADCDPLEIGDGRLKAEVPEKELPRVLSVLLNIGRKLAEPVDVERQIVQNARHDPEAGVRIFNLLLLVGECPGEPETLEALRGACSDASPALRLRAAMELGEEGRDVLQQIAHSSEDDASSARAVTYIRSELSLERLKEILSRALDQGLIQTARACLEALGRRGAAAVEAEPLLLQALQGEDGDLRVAAAQALGRVGSTAAVLPLQVAAEGFWLDRELRQAARQATAEIQARLEGASPGQLSLAEAEAGQLSLAQAEAGQLSLPPEEPEQPARETQGGRPV